MYEKLLMVAKKHGVETYEEPMKPSIKGLYGEKIIWINKYIPTSIEKACILAEELGHYFTSSGNIIDQSKLENRKQEKRARNWAYDNLIPLEKIVQAHKQGVRNRYELSSYLNVTEEFLEEAVKHFKEKYGLYKIIGNVTIYFEPLSVLEMFIE